MINPEIELLNRERAQNSTSIPIIWAYTGNYSQYISLNQGPLLRLIDIIGKSKTTLVIKDGKERIERTGIIVKILGGSFMNGSEQTPDVKNLWNTNINKEKQELEISINSQVIDGRIRDFYPMESYQRIFLQVLEEIILKGIISWAFYEAKEKGFKNLFKNRKKNKELKEFFLKHGSEILLIDHAANKIANRKR